MSEEDRERSDEPTHVSGGASQKSLGKRRALSPDLTARHSPPPAKRRRSSSAPQSSRRIIDLDSEIAAAAIDLTGSDSDVPLANGTSSGGLFGDEEVGSDDEEISWIVDRAKERHAAAMGPKEVVDLTAEPPDSPIAGPSRPAVNKNGRQFLSELSCPICMTPPSPLVVTRCGHCFCGPCLHSAMYQQTSGQPGTPAFHQGSIDDGRCPVCRAELQGGWGKAIRGCSFKVGPITSVAG